MRIDQKPLVSVVVPVYGVEKYIEACVHSLAKQTYDNCEWVFVDDCTPDGSIGVIERVMSEYSGACDKARIIRHEHNRGLAAARNTGVCAARGEYVLHLDSDDYLEAHTVERCVSRALAVGADAVLFGMRHVMSGGRTHVESIGRTPASTEEYVKSLLKRERPVCVCGGLYKRSLYVDNGVAAVEGLNFGEDYSTKPRIMYYAQKVEFIDEPLYNYTHYNEGAYTQSFKPSIVNDLARAVKVLSDFFADKGEDWRDAVRLTALKSQIEMLLAWGLHNGDMQSWQRIRALYCDLPLDGIGVLYKSVLLLARLDMPGVERVYVRTCVYGKALLKRVRGNKV